MDAMAVGACRTWKPASGGVSAVVTVQALDLEKGRALVHVPRRCSGGCSAHWVDLDRLFEAPEGAGPCACTPVTVPAPLGGGDAA